MYTYLMDSTRRENQSPTQVTILHLSHTYPSVEAPWTTPFMQHMLEALGERENTSLHLLIPEGGTHQLKNGIIHTFPLSESNPIPHKRLSTTGDRISLRHGVQYLLRAFLTARQLCREVKPDLIHAHWAIPSGLVAWLLFRATGIPYIVTTHGKDVLDAPQFGYGISSSWKYRFLIKLVLRNAARVVATSEFTEKATRKLCPKARIEVIPVGIPSSPMPDTSVPRENFILYVGDLIPRKGVDILIRGIAIWRDTADVKEIPRLIIAGDGPERGNLHSLADSLSVPVQFLGSIPPEKVQELMKKARCLAFCSQTEAFGIVILEAISGGTAVIGANVGVVPQLANDPTFNPILIPFTAGSPESLKNALAQLQESRPLRLSKNIHTRLNLCFSWSAIAMAYEALQYQIMKNEH